MPADTTNSPVAKRWTPRNAVWKILGIGALTCGYGAIPAVLDRGHTFQDIIHSGLVQLGLAVCFVLLTIVYGSWGIQRSAEADRSPWPIYWGMLAILFAGGMLAIVVPSVSAHQLAVDLDTRGVPVQARVVRHFTEGCGKSGCITKLEYAFSARPAGQTFRGYVDEGNVSHHSNSQYEYAISTGTIPVLYDPDDPNRSAVYWSSDVHRQAAEGALSTTAKVLTGFLIFFVLLMGFLLYPAARNASLDRAGVI